MGYGAFQARPEVSAATRAGDVVHAADSVAGDVCVERPVDAGEYRAIHADAIGNAIVAYLTLHPIDFAHPFLSFMPYGPVILDGARGKALHAKLDYILGRPAVAHLVDRSRATKDETGPSTWFPDVGVELGQALHERMKKSLHRIAPRFVQASLAAAPDRPRTADIVGSDPIDTYVIAALVAHGHVDLEGHKRAHPSERGQVGALRTLTLAWETPEPNKGFWLRVTAPSDPTVEEVAHNVFGVSTAADKVRVAAHPLYGIDAIDDVLPHHRLQLAKLQAHWKFTFGDVRDDAVTGTHAKEVGRSQSGRVVASLATSSVEVLRVLDQNLTILGSIESSATLFPATLPTLKQLRARIAHRRVEVAEASDEQASAWADQAEAQRGVLTDIAISFKAHADVLHAMMKELGSNVPPPPALLKVGTAYARAAMHSDLPTTAREELAVADEEAGNLPIAILEGALSQLQARLAEVHKPKHSAPGGNADYSADALRRREESLRARITALRTMPATQAAKEIVKLGAELQDLSTETTIVDRFDQIDRAWDALDGIDSDYGTPGVRGTKRLLVEQGQLFYGQWKKIYATYKSGDTAGAQSELDAMTTSNAVFDRWLEAIGEAAKQAGRMELYLKLQGYLGAAVATGQIGALVRGAVAGWGGPATLISLGVEGLTFSAFSALIEQHFEWKTFLYEAATNAAMGAALRRFAMLAQAAKFSKTGTVVATNVMGVALGLAKVELERLVASRGQSALGSVEAATVIGESLGMAVVQHSITPEPMYVELEKHGYAFGARLRANNMQARVNAKQREALAGKITLEQAREYLVREHEWLDERIRVLEEIEREIVREQQTTGKSSVLERLNTTTEKFATARAELEEKRGIRGQEASIAMMTPIGPNEYLVPISRIEIVLGAFRENGSTPRVVDDGRTTGSKTYAIDVEPPGQERSTIVIIEEIPPTARGETAIPDLSKLPAFDRIEGVTGVKKGPAYETAMAEMRDFYAAMQSEPKDFREAGGVMRDGAYATRWGNRSVAINGRTHFTIRVALVPSHVVMNSDGAYAFGAMTGATPADIATMQTRIRTGVDRYYNNNAVAAVDGSVNRGNPIQYEVEFVDLAHAHVVVGVHPGSGNANAGNFYLQGPHAAPLSDAHELTHGGFGIHDEYVDKQQISANRNNPGDPGVFNDNSIMGDVMRTDENGMSYVDETAQLKPRHYDQIHQTRGTK